MDVIYVANVAPASWFTALVEKKTAISLPAYKFNNLIIHGLSKNGVRVHVPVEPSLWKALSGTAGDVYEEDGVLYHLMPDYSGAGEKVKNLRKWILETIKESEAPHILCDILYVLPTSVAVWCAKKTHTKVTGIVTDLPEFLRSKKRSIKKRLAEVLQKETLKKYDGYVLMTEEMKNKLHKGKPYMVMEGLVDIEDTERPSFPKNEKKTCIYAGAIHKIYGISMLTEAFIKAEIQNAELHIYGNGDYAEELSVIAAKTPSVKWQGIVPNEKVVEEEIRATLLINPRPTIEEFTKYSFPSKNMEYMLSGTPVLTTKLPGMPPEYYPFVFLAEEETVDGWAKTLKKVLSENAEELEEKGQSARQFVLEKKNNVFQANRIMRFMESL